MKDCLKKLMPNVFFVAVWFLYDTDIDAHNESVLKSVVSVVAFSVSLLCFFVIKKPYYSVLPALIMSVAVSFYNVEYLFFYVPVFIVIYMYMSAITMPEVGKEKKSSSENLTNDALMVVSINFSIAIAIYGFIKLLSYPDNHNYTLEFSISVYSLVITAFLTIFLFYGTKNKNSYRKRKQESKTKSKVINNINIVSVIIYASQLFAYYSSAHHNSGYFGIAFFPWFMYILIVIYNKDANYLAFIDSFEAKIENFLNAKRE